MIRIIPMNLVLAFTFFLIAISLFSCAANAHLQTIKLYLNGSTVEAKSKYMAESYHSYFFEKKGEGENKTEAIRSFLDWNAQLDPDIRLLTYLSKDSIWTVTFNEQNDFSKLIGYPGWKGKMIIAFESKRKIKELV